MILHWGIVSAGKISTGFVKALSILPDTEHTVVAIAARDLQRAQEFAKTFKIDTAYGSYEQLAKDPDVNIVYVGCIHPHHFEVSKMMLENGKHVLCEKPLTMNEKQTKKLIEIAKTQKLFLMEAIWSRCFPIYDELKELIEAGIIGEVRYVSTEFGLKLNKIDRINLKELGGGTILDLGIYNLQFQQFIFRYLEPLSFVSSGHLNRFGTDESANAILTYPEGKTSILSCHSAVELTNEAIVVGDKGMIRVPFFWRPTTMITPKGAVNIDLPKSQYDDVRPGGMSYEADEVRRCIQMGLLESPKITHEESIQLARMMDNMRKQIGVVYDEDKQEY